MDRKSLSLRYKIERKKRTKFTREARITSEKEKVSE
jgi:hypothetical protein